MFFLLDVFLEHPIAIGMAQFSECFGLDLTDAFSGDVEDLANLLQGFQSCFFT